MTDPLALESRSANRFSRFRSSYAVFLGGAALIAVGAIVGAGAVALTRPVERSAFDPAMATTDVAKLTDDTTTAVEGRVADIFGNKFVLEDKTGRALVDTGRDGEDHALVLKDETIKVQGRYDRAELHASALQHADGRTEELRAGPPRPPHDGPERGAHGRDRGAPPLPPPGQSNPEMGVGAPPPPPPAP